MIRSIDGAAVAAQVRMERQTARKKSFLILEGSDDLRVFRNFIQSDACELVNAYKKQNVIDAIHHLEDDGCMGVCGIVDADFDSILNIKYDSDNVISTGCHDLDVLIFMTRAFEKYLSIVSDEGLTQAFEKRVGNSLKDCVLRTAGTLGAARLASAEKSLNVYFKDLELSEYIDDSLALNEEIFTHLVDRSHNPRCNARQLKTFSENVLSRGVDSSILCQGHDVAQVLGLALRSIIGKRRIPQTWGSEIEIGLRLCFDFELFMGSQLYKSMRSWEEQNVSWILLRSLAVGI